MRINLIDLVSVDGERNLTIHQKAFGTLTETFKADRLGAAFDQGQLETVLQQYYIAEAQKAYPEATFLGVVAAQLNTDGDVKRDNGEAPILGVYTVFSIPDPQDPDKTITILGPYANTLGNETNRTDLPVEDKTTFVHALVNGIQAAAVKKYPSGDVAQIIYYPTPAKEYTTTPRDGHPSLATVQVATLPSLSSVSFIATPKHEYAPHTQARRIFLEKLKAEDPVYKTPIDPPIRPHDFPARTLHVIGLTEGIATKIVASPAAVKLLTAVTDIGLRVDLGLVEQFPEGLKLNNSKQRQQQIDDTGTLIVAYKETHDGKKDFQNAEARQQELAALTQKVESRLLGE
jgi:hypothetical protein